MYQMFLFFIILIAGGILTITSIVFLVVTIIKWEKRKRYTLSLVLFAVFGISAILVFNINLTSWESTNREDSVEAFESNFGFTPPPSVDEIKVKNFFLYDASAHWMSFTYDSIVFEKILLKDQPLLVAIPNTSEHSESIREFARQNPNAPDWYVAPNFSTEIIYYKKDFLDYSRSEYYLWRSSDMVYLEVSYSD